MLRFSNGSKFFILSLLTFFTFGSLAYSKSPDTDPCNNIAGKWKGTGGITTSSCLWDAKANFFKYENTIRMEYTVSNVKSCSSYPTVHEGQLVASGTCKDAMINFQGVTGTIFGNSITMEHGSSIYTHLVKE